MARPRTSPKLKPPKTPRHRPGPEGGTRDTNRKANLDRLCEAGLALFLAEGTAAVTIDQIAARAGMAKGSFYRYVEDKAELVARILEPMVADTLGALDRCEAALRSAKPAQVTAVYLQLGMELSQAIPRHASRVLLYLQEARSPPGGTRAAVHAFADQVAARGVALTETARAQKLIRNVDPQVSAMAVIGATEAILYAHLRGRDVSRARASVVIPELVELVLRGIRE
ncbi:MAG: TetR/AcrR family transcriptional regulator [Kofleriaceae bacterium]